MRFRAPSPAPEKSPSEMAKDQPEDCSAAVDQNILDRSRPRGNERLMEFIERCVDRGDDKRSHGSAPEFAATSSKSAPEQSSQNRVLRKVGAFAHEELDCGNGRG